MKRTLILLAALTMGVGLNAQTDSFKSSYSVTTDFTYTSRYVFRGVQVAKDSFQPSVEASVGGFFVNLWTNQPIAKHQNDEIDFQSGYRQKVTSDLTLEALVNYYWYPEFRPSAITANSLGIRTDVTGHSLEGGVGASYNAGGFTPSIYYYYDFQLKADTVEGSIGYSIPLPDIGTSVDLSIYGGAAKIDDVAPGYVVRIKQSYNYYGMDLRLPYQISRNSKLTLGAHWAANENYFPGIPKDRVWVDVGFTVGF